MRCRRPAPCRRSAVARAAALLFRLDAFDGLPDDAAVEQSALGFGFRQLWHGVALRCFAARVASFAALARPRPHDALTGLMRQLCRRKLGGTTSAPRTATGHECGHTHDARARADSGPVRVLHVSRRQRASRSEPRRRAARRRARQKRRRRRPSRSLSPDDALPQASFCCSRPHRG